MKPQRVRNLREAAATIFAVSGLLPLLVSFLILWRSDLVWGAETGVALALAVFLSVLGFVLFRRMVDRISTLAQAVQSPAVVESGVPPVSGHVPGVGPVAEIRQIGEAFAGLFENLRASTDRLEDLAFKLGTLNEMVEVAARIPDIQELLTLVLERTMRTVRATIGSIMLLDREGQVLRIAAARGLPQDAVARVEVPIGEGIVGRAAELGEPVVVDDAEIDPAFAKTDGRKYGRGSLICLPVRVGDRVIGVINLARTEDGAAGPHVRRSFSPTDLQFLNSLTRYIAYALDNARLLEETRQTAKRLQEMLDDLRATQTQLVRVETLRAVGELASGTAHHLNNLLTVILGRIELLLRRVQESDIRRSLEILQRAAKDGAEVVRRVGSFTWTQPVPEPVPVDLNELAREVVELTRTRWQNEAQLRGISIEVSLDPGDIPTVPGEPFALREVLLNVLLNAVDALPQGGWIAVKTWASGQRVHCAVADTGVGMSEEVRRRALEPFFTTKGPKSTGLGLSVSFGVIQRHGGDLQIESSPGRGTTVTIRLPLGRAVPPDPVRAVTSVPPLRILLIEDEPEVLETLAQMLASAGHLVSQAAGGQEGLACLEGGTSVDLVLTDLGMPGMTGWEVARSVKARWPQLPVGVITGWGEELESFREECQRVDFVIRKPVTIQALNEALAQARPGR